MKRRIFIAILLPEDIKKDIVDWQKNHLYLQVRWIKPENLHITLAPPWYADENELHETVKVIIESIREFPSFEVDFKDIFPGPPGNAPRLIWAEGKTPEEFISLKERVENSLFDNKTGFLRKEKRQPKLHLTVARFNPAMAKLPEFREKINWNFIAEKAALMQSQLKRGGAEYAVLQKFILKNK